MNIYAYIRVSTKDQNLSRQYDSMYAQGLDDSHIFADKQSGKNFSRPAYERLMNTVKEGDLILFHSLDRMGRNYTEMSEQWFTITHIKKVNIKVLDMPILNTANSNDTMGKLIAEIVFNLLSYMAQNERENTLKRQEEGIKAARARGVVFGRKPKEKPENYELVKELWQKKEIGCNTAAKLLACSHTTFMKWMKADGVERGA